MRHRAATRWIVLLTAAALFAACDSGTDPLPEYNPQETLTQLDAVVRPLDLGYPVFDAFWNIGDYFAAYGAPFGSLLRAAGATTLRGALPDRAVTRRIGDLRVARAATGGGAGVQPRLAFPSAVMGETLVWDPSQGYVVDPTASTPETVVRVVYYTTDNDGFPTTPLTPLGYIDFTDEDRSLADRIGVRVMETTAAQTRERAQYTIEASGTGTNSEGTLELRVDGHVVDGTRLLELDLVQQFAWSEAENSYRMDLDYLMEGDRGPVAFAVAADGPLDQDVWYNAGYDVTFGAAGSDRVEVSVDIDDDGRLSGGIQKGNRTVIELSGFDGEPEFRRPSGPSLTSSDIAALEDLWTGLADVVWLVDALIWPADLLFLLPG